MVTKEEYHKKRKEYFIDKKVEKQVELFRKSWHKNFRKAHKLGWDSWSFIKKLEYALRLIELQEGDNSSQH